MTSVALRSRAWKLLEMVTTPLLPADYLDLVSPLRAGADLRGRIEAVHPETPDAATIVIRPGKGWRGHVAGQYIRVGVDVDGVRLWRAYSVTSPTRRQDGRITITVKAIPDGKVSNYLVRRARPGMMIQLDQATGEFVLP
ncbi:MAG: stearoyl-CoA 9-desaturase oxidoreductase, partial [Pseudonocardiales bacterium]|nr:stearoyl-CoA 9-desaturase oxidoreductase [Pseudonocardiales bacterium]